MEEIISRQQAEIKQAMNETVKTCPFCGSDAHVVAWDGDIWVKCLGNLNAATRDEGCYVSGPHRDTEGEAIAAWNTRLSFRPVSEVVGKALAGIR